MKAMVCRPSRVSAAIGTHVPAVLGIRMCTAAVMPKRISGTGFARRRGRHRCAKRDRRLAGDFANFTLAFDAGRGPKRMKRRLAVLELDRSPAPAPRLTTSVSSVRKRDDGLTGGHDLARLGADRGDDAVFIRQQQCVAVALIAWSSWSRQNRAPTARRPYQLRAGRRPLAQ